MTNIKFLQFRLLLFCVFGCASSFVYAQDIERIKSDPSYFWAEGHGITSDKAEEDALAIIARQISVSISTKQEASDKSERRSDGTNNSTSTQTGSTKSVSFASFQNVDRKVIKPEPDAVVFMWVSKSEVNKMVEARKQKILDYVNTGKTAERRLQIDDALRYYYWALVLATVNSEPVYADFNGEQQNCLTFLPLKIKSVISQIKAITEECTSRDNRYYAKLRFTYNGNDVSSVQLSYFDGQSYVGLLKVKDGMGELDFVSLASDEKIKIQYEYGFRKEAGRLDADLGAIFSGASAPLVDNAYVEVPVKGSLNKNTVTSAIATTKPKDNATVVASTAAANNVAPEPIVKRQRMDFTKVENSNEYADILRKVEAAIRKESPQDAYPYFTTDGYMMLKTLINETGSISVVGDKQNYEFIRANGQILGRSCRVKIKFRNGKIFNEDIVFRFNEDEKKIQSIAFTLSKKAEDDIFNAASSWTEISRFTILQFMEDYQTAYSLKRLDYIDKIFSEDAIIITGTVLKTAPRAQVEGMPVVFERNNVSFTKQTKDEYLKKLRIHFEQRDYIHLTFEDNITKVINAPRIPKGTVFAIQINQKYDSPVYSDKGYLTLLLDTSSELPIIHVRLWQPEASDMLTLDKFMNRFEF